MQNSCTTVPAVSVDHEFSPIPNFSPDINTQYWIHASLTYYCYGTRDIVQELRPFYEFTLNYTPLFFQIIKMMHERIFWVDDLKQEATAMQLYRKYLFITLQETFGQCYIHTFFPQM